MNVTEREESLLLKLRELICADIKNEMITLNRKLKKMEEQRDEWKYQALKYRKQLLEKK